ncbi:hypothetical protein MJO28_016212 [Puccinia striiformis f. sp. tritici]|uniref:Uncharacterized protein n=1 Tax=Puccinia striiformis f. sp. tritici TaxID=168172 RepID=A0ACC0DMZ9_9BASI|nr:hypothetical protein MJO29_016414 [Puccinia striiformis f. sp. tritici]KAI7935341.1 hypothetical protein MJO28_016212 [Puccinia striiformis f. sp. tritici]
MNAAMAAPTLSFAFSGLYLSLQRSRTVGSCLNTRTSHHELYLYHQTSILLPTPGPLSDLPSRNFVLLLSPTAFIYL